MKKFIVSILLLIIGVFVSDRVLGVVFSAIHRHSKHELSLKLHSITDTQNSDILLMGTSRCERHYDPRIISKKIGASVYNGGINGSEDIYSHYFLLCHVVERYKPVVIVLDLKFSDIYTSNKDAECFNAISKFAPLIGRNKEADKVAELNSNYILYNISHVYRYNNYALSNIVGLFLSNVHDISGFTSLSPSPITPSIVDVEDKGTPDTQKLTILNSFISLCKEKGVKLILCVSPALMNFKKDYFFPAKQIAFREGVCFWDYHDLYINKPEFFYDNGHLCDKGAEAFSEVFANDLKEYFDNE